MPKQVRYYGEIHVFPDSFTDEQISAALAEVNREKFPASEPESAVSRFAGGAWKNVNPVNIGKGLYGMVRHPIDTAAGAAGAMAAEWEKAGIAAMGGNYVEAVGHGAAGTIPFLGPAAAAAGERIGAGDVAGGLGEGVGLLIPTMAPRAMGSAARALRGVTGSLAERTAGALESGAAAKLSDVMSPKVGANKVRLGNTAERIAPSLVKDLATDGAPLTREGFHQTVQTRLAVAERALDEAADARLATKAFSAKDILAKLEAKKAELTSQAVGRGKDVVPAPNSARVAVLDQAISEVKRVRGPMVRYEPIRIMRQAYDGQAKVIYNPSMTADFLKHKGAAMGAADVTGVLREALAKWDPQTNTANAQYALYRAADDVLKATAEVERVRPKVGRRIIARMAGTILGDQAAGVPGAVAGYVAGPILDSALASGVTTQLKTAALMSKLAAAVRSGDLGMTYSITHQLKRLGVTSAAVTGAATPAPSMQPAPATQ